MAEAAFYPTLSLTGLLGVQSAELSELFGEGRLWNVQAGLLGPIFNAGRLRNQRRTAAMLTTAGGSTRAMVRPSF